MGGIINLGWIICLVVAFVCLIGSGFIKSPWWYETMDKISIAFFIVGIILMVLFIVNSAMVI